MKSYAKALRPRLVSRKLNHLVVYDRSFAEVDAAARALLRGRPFFFPLFRRIKVAEDFVTSIGHLFEEVLSPRMMLLIAHGEQGGILSKGGLIAPQWWSGLPGDVCVFGYGCYSARYVEAYRLLGRIRAFLGYKDSIDVLFQGENLDPLFEKLLRRIGKLFLQHTSIDRAFYQRIMNIYWRALYRVKKTLTPERGDLLRLWSLESQSDSLFLQVEDQG